MSKKISKISAFSFFFNFTVYHLIVFIITFIRILIFSKIFYELYNINLFASKLFGDFFLALLKIVKKKSFKNFKK